MTLRDRGLLTIAKVPDFIGWATARGYVQEENKGVYEVFRLRGPLGMLIAYQRDSAIMHVTVHGALRTLVWRFLNETREAK